MSESFRIVKDRGMGPLEKCSCIYMCLLVYSCCWLQDQLTAGIDWHQQQQLPPQPLCSLDQQTRQRQVQHGIEETGDDGKLLLLESG